jgi:hypothetical protein
MSEEINDMNHPENKLPDSLDDHLRAIMEEKELNRFREQLPAEFLSDASEGLNQLKDSNNLNLFFGNLNQQMHRQLAQRKCIKEKPIEICPMALLAIIIILSCSASSDT